MLTQATEQASAKKDTVYSAPDSSMLTGRHLSTAKNDLFLF